MDCDDFPSLPCTSFYKKRFQSLAPAIEDIYSSSNSDKVDIIIIPPDADPQSDTEEIDDDKTLEENLQYPVDVAGEIELHYLENDENEDSEDDEIWNMPLSRLRETIINERKLAEVYHVSEPSWTQHVRNIEIMGTTGYADRLEIVKADLINSSPVEVFEKLWDQSVWNLLVEQTNLYSNQSNDHGFFVSEADMKIFVGFLFLSGYHKLPRERLYWSLDDDVKVPFVASVMSRNRFQEIKKYIHLADNTKLDKDDRMAKLRPLMNALNQNFQQWGVFHQDLSIDESMVKYFGHHSAKQFIKGKPIRFGYKNWLLCSATGYCYKFETYCGAKNVSESQPNNYKLPLGSKVVLDLLKAVAVPSDHVIFFDNYFSSHSLLKILRNMGHRATGTIRDNRTKKCPLTKPKTFQGKSRGYFEQIHDDKNLLSFIRWKDNNVVTMGTNYDTVEPLGKVKRWSATEKQKIDVPQPHLYQNYNRSMGGVDLHDQSINNYRVSIRGKKWWWPLFTQMMNMTVVNAWRLYQIAGDNKTDLLEFQREIARTYLTCYKKSSFVRSRPSGEVPSSIRKHDGGHFPAKLEKQLRCVHCHKRARWSCCKCRVTLCLERECFIKYHS